MLSLSPNSRTVARIFQLHVILSLVAKPKHKKLGHAAGSADGRTRMSAPRCLSWPYPNVGSFTLSLKLNGIEVRRFFCADAGERFNL